MRVVLVGSEAGRARLRDRLPESVVIAGEAMTITEARELVPDADGWLIAPENREGAARHEPALEPLTPRERQVLALLADGLSNKTIAARLGVSDQTIKFHVASICGKLAVANRTEAVRAAIRRGLVQL